jgi:hypothetical protein
MTVGDTANLQRNFEIESPTYEYIGGNIDALERRHVLLFSAYTLYIVNVQELRIEQTIASPAWERFRAVRALPPRDTVSDAQLHGGNLYVVSRSGVVHRRTHEHDGWLLVLRVDVTAPAFSRPLRLAVLSRSTLLVSSARGGVVLYEYSHSETTTSDDGQLCRLDHGDSRPYDVDSDQTTVARSADRVVVVSRRGATSRNEGTNKATR